MTCNIDPLLLDGFVDGQLNARDQFDLNTHLMQCHSCRATVAQLRQSKAAIEQMQAPALSDGFNAALAAKIAAHENAKVTPHQQPLGGSFHSKWPWLASAASVALTVVGVSYLMLTQAPDDDMLALDGSIPIIEISEPQTVQSDIASLTVATDIEAEHAMYWSDEDYESFERFTVVDDGFQEDSCGSTVGEKACTLGPGFQVATLDVMTSI